MEDNKQRARSLVKYAARKEKKDPKCGSVD